MKQPAYHLRPNKAVDRFVFMAAIGRLAAGHTDLQEYSYYSLGGPYMEDFRIMYESFPKMRMTSVEVSDEIVKRQRFHLPCSTVTLKTTDVGTFLTTYPGDEKSIFWLDYTGLRLSHFEELMSLLPKVSSMSMIKVTLEADGRKYHDPKMASEFKREFDKVLPDPSSDPPVTSLAFAVLLQKMVRIAAERALPAALPFVFQPLNCFYYDDRTPMFTLTGIVCERTQVATVRGWYDGWEFANFEWSSPRLIDLPILSTKERLHLQRSLPCVGNAGKTLRESLGYLIDNDIAETDAKLEQYASYHRLSPYFIRGIP